MKAVSGDYLSEIAPHSSMTRFGADGMQQLQEDVTIADVQIHIAEVEYKEWSIRNGTVCLNLSEVLLQ